jgi:methylated-DNA-[protein]-cysteine S-methyltransferase
MMLYDSPVGKLLITGNDKFITGVAFYRETGSKPPAPPANDIEKKCARELDEYFAGRLFNFTVPLQPEGTAFRKRVWDALEKIPYGKTISYKELAAVLGNPKASRAVGGANHHNPIVLLIPCHRVIGADGSLTGFGGGMEAKAFLIKHEKSFLTAAPPT